MLEFIGGLIMSLGGSVPGVSGGTVAFLMGFFDELINSVNAFVTKGSEKKKPLFFLLRLGAGYILGIALATLLVTAFFEEHIYPVSSLFIGITLFSVPLVIREERQTLKGKWLQALWILPGCALIVGITLLSSLGTGAASSTFAQIALAFPAGILVACAMIMPGISGAAIFYIFGLYQAVFGGIKNLVHLDFSALPMLISLGIGGLVGLFGVVKGVRWLLNKQRARTIYAIIGMMLGSIYSIWVGPKTLDPPKDALSFSTFNWLFFFIGGLFIAGFAALKIVMEKKRKNEEKQNAVGGAGDEKQ